MPSELWQRLRAARTHAQMTQQQVADACGVSREAVSQWESPDPAKRNTPGVPRLRIVSGLTGAPLDWLLNDDSEIQDGAWGEVDTTEVIPTPDREVFDVPVFSRRVVGSGVEEPRSHYGHAIGSLLFRRKSLERKGISLDNVEVHYAPDDAMLPTIARGAAVLLDGSAVDIVDGRVYVIDWGGQEQIRRLYRELDGSVRVVATNAAAGFPERIVRGDDPNFKVCGRVRWVGSWED